MCSTETVQKIGVVAEIFLLKAFEGVLHQWQKLSLTPLVLNETSTQTYSLSEEGFGDNYGRWKSSASHACREMTVLKKWKMVKVGHILQRGCHRVDSVCAVRA